MQTFTIGRDAGNQIVLNDKLVSRRHAQLTFLDNGQVMIKDLGSSNGTFVNGNRITECYLNVGDIVKCGSVFLNWAQYINSGHAPFQPMNYQQPNSNLDILQESNSIASINQYNFSDIFKYLTTRIFEIGDLFKTNWNRTFSVLFLKGIPVIVTFIASIIAYSKYRNAEFYFSPTILAVFLFGVSPFITMYLLSLSKKVQFDKVALASGIIGFIQFSFILCFLVYFWIFYHHISFDYGTIFTNSFEPHKGFDFFISVTTLLFITILVNLALAFYLFIYKYFISIGVNRSRSIYLIIITIALNSFFQILSSYIIFLIVKDSIGYFNL
jgi:hypothetical protein